MKEFQHKKDNIKKKYPKWVLFLLFVLIVVAGKGLASISTKQITSSEEMKLVEAKRAELEEKQRNLTSKVNELNTREGLEKEIRSKFDVVRPGEGVILVVDKEIQAPIKEEPSVIKKLWNGVVGVFKKKP